MLYHNTAVQRGGKLDDIAAENFCNEAFGCSVRQLGSLKNTQIVYPNEEVETLHDVVGGPAEYKTNLKTNIGGAYWDKSF